MLWQSIFAFALAPVTVVLHVVGIIKIVAPTSGVWQQTVASQKQARPVWKLTLLVSMLLVLHLLETGVWAAVFLFVGVFPNFETSLYYSLTSYTTVGYGDVLPAPSWRLLGPLEAAVGVLMLGLSTGVIVAAVQRIYNIRSASSVPPP
jgi:hypothetical protein